MLKLSSHLLLETALLIHTLSNEHLLCVRYPLYLRLRNPELNSIPCLAFHKFTLEQWMMSGHTGLGKTSPTVRDHWGMQACCVKTSGQRRARRTGGLMSPHSPRLVAQTKWSTQRPRDSQWLHYGENHAHASALVSLSCRQVSTLVCSYHYSVSFRSNTKPQTLTCVWSLCRATPLPRNAVLCLCEADSHLHAQVLTFPQRKLFVWRLPLRFTLR